MEAAVVGSPKNGAATSAKKDKKRKRKSLKKEEVEAEKAVIISPVDPEAPKSKKKKKKKSKKNKEEDTNGEAPTTTTNGEKKKKKKKKSGDKKRKSTENGNGNGEANGKSNDESKRPKKKSKTSPASETAPSTSSSSPSQPPSEERLKIVEEWRENAVISVSGDDSEGMLPYLSFEDADDKFPKKVMDHLKSRFEKPTPIQSQCWPILVAKRDIVGIAETGSGKTLAFLMPALLHIGQKPLTFSGKNKGPVVLILSPTRELAMQTADVCEEVGTVAGIKSVCIYGGVDKDPQRRALSAGVHIIVATPGRLLDLVNEGRCNLSQVTYLILDEADRMLDLGFEPDIRKIVAQISTQRQTLMFSATWPVIIQNLAKEFLNNPVRVTIGSEDLTACRNVTQIVEVIDTNARDRRLLDLLKQYHASRKNRVLIFVLYKKEAPRIESLLLRNGWQAKAIHGDKGQHDRSKALDDFKLGNQPLLIATDVAARGLDIPNVEYVINYSFPLTIEDYIHRIGRTGRAGKKGISHTFFTAFDKTKAGELVNILKEANQEVPSDLLKFGTHVKKKEHKLYGHHFKADEEQGPMPDRKHVKFD